MTLKELKRLRKQFGAELNVLNWNYHSNWELPTDQRATPEETARHAFLTRELMIIQDKIESLEAVRGDIEEYALELLSQTRANSI